MSDPINPDHYKAGGIEAIDVIEALGCGYLMGSVFKYLFRVGRKGPALEDLRKARWFLDRHIANMEREGGK